MKAFYTLLILLIPFVGFGQGWETTVESTFNSWGFSSSGGFSVQQTTDGGYIITGETESYDLIFNILPESGKIYLLKTDSNGNEQWSKTFGDEDYNSCGLSVQQTTDGGYIIAGYLIETGYGIRTYLIKTDSNGNEQWSKEFAPSLKNSDNNDISYSVQQTNDGGYIMTGRSIIFDSVAFLIKTDESGNELWTKTFGDGDDDSGNFAGFSVQQTTDGGYIITGTTSFDYDSGEETDVLLIKTDSSGNELWTKTFVNDFPLSVGWSVQQTTDGGYIITGTTSFDFVGTEQADVLLIKTDSSGNELWTKTFGGLAYLRGHSVQQTTDGGYIITGHIGFEQSDVYLIKTDSNGNEQWSKTFGNAQWSKTLVIALGFSVQQTTDGGYIITGSKLYASEFDLEGNASAYTRDVYLIKTNSFGNITSTTEIPLPNPNRKLEKTINLQGQEVKHQTNQPIIEIYDDGTVEKKVIIE